ncbi:hypothetical protein [Streptosporangium sp. NPDC050280]|uniref:hypothetical protein n=1 Tax=unclassified Streptosporangium TaxID=2632669 RepID=UPI00342BD32C
MHRTLSEAAQAAGFDAVGQDRGCALYEQAKTGAALVDGYLSDVLGHDLIRGPADLGEVAGADPDTTPGLIIRLCRPGASRAASHR